MQKKILSRAPVRICDIGGWTDTWFNKRGTVLNFCIDLYSYVYLVETKVKKIRISSDNLGLKTIVEDLNHIEYNGTLDLIKAGIRRLGIIKGLDIYIRTEAPPSSGMGTSASVAVALISALSKIIEKNLTNEEIAELAHKLEVEELNLESGVQDQYAAAFGGINFMDINYPSVNLEKIKISKSRRCELEKQFILVFIRSRSSSEMHKAIIKNYMKGDRNTISSFEIMKSCAKEMKNAIHSDIRTVGEIMNRNWNAQKKLHPIMTNPLIKKAENIAIENQAIGFKCNGAGGGGSITVLAPIEKEYEIRKEFQKNGFIILPCKLSFNGVQSFEL
jgi:D-glycero-alpha-D-manno-heptose-7-phosphate kinase